jgi:3-oxoacyl-[acyl-carrier-protein] synthase-3
MSPFISLFGRAERESSKDLLVSLAMFGDGAGAIVLAAGGESNGVLGVMSRSMSTGRPAAMMMRVGGALEPVPFAERDERGADNHRIFQHDYQAIMEHGPDLIRSASSWLRDEQGYDFSAFRYIVPPQVNQRMIDLTVKLLDLPAGKVVSDFARVGNTVSASIYLALDHLSRTGALKRDDLLVLLPAEATKWIYGGIVLRWTKGST